MTKMIKMTLIPFTLTISSINSSDIERLPYTTVNGSTIMLPIPRKQPKDKDDVKIKYTTVDGITILLPVPKHDTTRRTERTFTTTHKEK